MSSQFRYLLTPEQVINTLLRAHGEAEAMEIAVGGDFERIGVLEHALLREAGLRRDSSVIDVGCGAGRLSVQLARLPDLRYLGTDVVPTVLDFARRRTARPDFRFIHVDRISIPAPDETADIVCFFSVLTHLLHEESYLYLQEARRVLKPGGRVVFSFFEHATPMGETVFAANLEWVRKRIVASQLNVFLHRSDIRLWARRLGFGIEMLRDGEVGSITVGPEEATAAVPAGSHAFGQSICVLRKPASDEDGDDTGMAAARASKRSHAAQTDPSMRQARRTERRRARAMVAAGADPRTEPNAGSAASEERDRTHGEHAERKTAQARRRQREEKIAAKRATGPEDSPRRRNPRAEQDIAAPTLRTDASDSSTSVTSAPDARPGRRAKARRRGPADH